MRSVKAMPATHGLLDLSNTSMKRIRRAFTLPVEYLGETTYRVTGAHGVYRVDLSRYTCQCPDFVQNGKTCSHLIAGMLKVVPPAVRLQVARRAGVCLPLCKAPTD